MRVTAFRCTSDHTTAKSALSIGNLAIQQIVPSWSCRLCRHLTTYCAARSQAEAIKAIGSQQPGLVRADVFLSCGTSHKSPHTRQKYCSTSASVQMQFQKLTGSKCASGPEPILFAAPSDPDRTSSFPGPTVAWFLAGKDCATRPNACHRYHDPNTCSENREGQRTSRSRRKAAQMPTAFASLSTGCQL